MVKHKRWSDNFKKLPPKDTDLENTKEIIDETTTTDLKSILRSGTKYAYILVAAALLSGIFTPLTLGVESEKVIFGMLIIFLGMFGGVVILLGIKKQKSTFLMVSGGLGMMIISLILIYELADRSIII
tara:strand:- start:252 stop:635 length:384 start_codon:yes stop_codon:yes gene_type:complete